MLGKLIKYEFKATARTFIPLYGLILVVSALHRLVGRDVSGPYMELNQIGDITTLVLVVLFATLGVLTLVVTIQRFSKNLLGDEGYLMFTLPTSTRKLILSKMFVAIAWIVLSIIVAGISFCILFIDGVFLEQVRYILGEFKYLLTEIGINDLLLLAQAPVLGILNYVQFLLVVYFALCIGHLPPFQKHRVAVGIIAFIMINMVLGWFVSFAGAWIPDTFTANNLFYLLNGITIVLSIGLFEAVHYILNKHLNLE